MKAIVSILFLVAALTASAHAAVISLGHSSFGVPLCGTPSVQTFVNGFNSNGTVHGVVLSRTVCEGWIYVRIAETSWGLTGKVVYTQYPCVGDCSMPVPFSTKDTQGRSIYNEQIDTGTGKLYRSVLYVPNRRAR